MTAQTEQIDFSIKVYFDGLCHLCSREIEHYKKMKGSERINFVDITGPSFDSKLEGLDPIEVHRNLHAKDSEGRIYKGVDTFILIWSQLEALKKFVPFASRKPIKSLMESMYFVFVRIRPLLPRKSCQNSPFCETHFKR